MMADSISSRERLTVWMILILLPLAIICDIRNFHSATNSGSSVSHSISSSLYKSRVEGFFWVKTRLRNFAAASRLPLLPKKTSLLIFKPSRAFFSLKWISGDCLLGAKDRLATKFSIASVSVNFSASPESQLFINSLNPRSVWGRVVALTSVAHEIELDTKQGIYYGILSKGTDLSELFRVLSENFGDRVSII